MAELPGAAKRPAEASGSAAEAGEAPKRPRAEEPAAQAVPAAAGEPNPEEDDFDALLDGAAADLLGELAAPPEPADEVARREFAAKVAGARQVGESDLPGLLATLQREAPGWAPLRRWRSVSLLLACIARSSRVVRAVFVSEGLPLLGAALQESVRDLEEGGASARQEAGMWALACLMCLRALPLGRATLWEHRHALGKPFDRLHRWCGREKSALAAELRAPTSALCRKWRRQPKPAGQETAPEQRAIRGKAVEIIQQGLMGISGGSSPASPAPIVAASPGALPNRLVAAEVEAAVFGRFGAASSEYKQHARMLRSNLALPGNAKLRERVLAGDISAEDLAAMDSDALAPDALRAERRAAQERSMKEAVVEDMLPRLPSKGEGSPGRDSYNWSTAPPVFVKSPARGESRDSLPSRTGADASTAEASNPGDASTAEASKPAGDAVLPPLVPPPTPFQDIGFAATPAQPHESEQHEPEVLATPAADDDDEEQDTLIRYLSKPVK